MTGSRVCFSPTVPGIMANLSALETSPFSHTFSVFLGGEFLEPHRIDFHGIRIGGGSGSGGVWSSEVGVSYSPSKFIDV